MKTSGYFPNLCIHMTEIGEETGNLPDVLSDLSDYYLQEAEIQKEIQQSIYGPLTLCGVLSIVIVFLVALVLPIFTTILEPLGLDIHTTFAYVLGQIIMFVTLTILLLSLIFALLYHFVAHFRLRVRRFASHHRPMRSILDDLNVARFTKAFALAYSSGIQIERSLQFAIQLLTEDSPLKPKAFACIQQLQEGVAFEQASKKTHLLVGLDQQILLGGAHSGKMDQALFHISEHRFERAYDRISDFTNLIEPLLVGFLSLAIGAILISILLPLVGVLSSLT
jgi:type IV pilus assembly protein PilC